jgi:hypothetical protein
MLLIAFTTTLSGQTEPVKESLSESVRNPKINTTFFILGTLSDYMGHYRYVNKKYQVDRYYSSEKPLMDYINRLIEKDLKTKVILENSTEGAPYETFSEEFSIQIKTYYGENDLIVDSLFKTSNEICSYLTGQFYRYGDQLNDSIYRINLTNSPNRKLCDRLLREVDCRHVYIKDLNKNIPAHYILYFVPSFELRSYFEKISSQKAVLTKSENAYWASITGGEKEFLKARESNNQKDLDWIIQIIIHRP